MEENVEGIIHELISIEDQCAEVTKGINEEAAELNTRISVEKRKIDEAMEARINEEIRIINAAAVEDARAKMIETSAQSQKMFAQMERDYETHSEEWARELFEMVIME